MSSSNQINSEFNIQNCREKFINSMVEGFELLELIFNDDGEVIDFKFLEINPAYEIQTGLKAAEILGKLKKQKAPASDQRWYDYAIQAVKLVKP